MTSNRCAQGLGRLLMAAVLAAAVSLTRAQQPAAMLDIGVRSDIDTPKWQKAKDGGSMRDALANRKLFALAPPQFIRNAQKLVKPVNGDAILQELVRQLLSHGYQPAGPGVKPDIVITLHYGRGEMKNPYLEHDNDGGSYNRTGMGSADMPGVYGVPIATIDTMPIRSREAGTEEKTQRASYEKLTLLVSAWDYNAAMHGKAKRLWATSMYVDDPDHRDLGQIYKQMLAVGVEYFNQPMKEEEVQISTPLRSGRVEVGTPTVVESDKSAPTK